MNKRFVSFIIMAFVLVVLTTSCRLWKNSTKPPKHNYSDTIISQIKDSDFTFNYLSSKFKGEFESEENSLSFSGTIRIKRDSAIWISVAPVMGIELFRLLVTKDSLQMINRLEKTYLKSSIKDLSILMKSDVNYEILEAVITGNFLNAYSYDNLEKEITGQLYQLTLPKREYIHQKDLSIYHEILVEPKNFKIVKQTIQSSQDSKNVLSAEYLDFTNIDDRHFPQRILISIKGQEALSIKLEYGKTRKESALRFPFSIPSKYSEVFLKKK